jgi:hypothetical protein
MSFHFRGLPGVLYLCFSFLFFFFFGLFVRVYILNGERRYAYLVLSEYDTCMLNAECHSFDAIGT